MGVRSGTNGELELRVSEFYIIFFFKSMGCETKDVKAKNALKAKLRRVCELKMNGQPNVPQWLHDQWKNSKGSHLQMALELQKVGFNKDP